MELMKVNNEKSLCCFFCAMQEADPCFRKAGIANSFREMLTTDDNDNILVLSYIWSMAMANPDSSELPVLGIFECMARLIEKGIKEEEWLRKGQNIYIPYYAAHIIGSYTMKKSELAELAVKSGVVIPLLELLTGKMSWVEQRVAVRALGHLASYSSTFSSVVDHEKDVVRLAMEIASSCLHVIYVEFLNIHDVDKRVKYHRDLLTRGLGGIEMENQKAEEWASQLQCWSLYLLNCFASKGMSLEVICKKDFLRDLCGMWGGLVNNSSPAGVGLIRILCYRERGRALIADTEEVIICLCNLSRSSDDWQYLGIDCLIMLLKDSSTRNRVMKIALFYCIDLVEIKRVRGKTQLGDAITRALLLDYKPTGKHSIRDGTIHRALREIWDLKVERRKRERLMTEERIGEKRVLLDLIKQQAKRLLGLGNIEGAVMRYSEAIDLCPLKLLKERMNLYSRRAQCFLLLNDPDAAISDSTRALCLSNPVNSHAKSLWRRSQAYDMKGLAKESLMDCIIFVNGFISSNKDGTKIPYYAVRMISKQMEATWLFASVRSRPLSKTADEPGKLTEVECDCYGSSSSTDEKTYDEILMRMMMEKRGFLSGLATIAEEPWIFKKGREKERLRSRSELGRDKAVTLAQSL